MTPAGGERGLRDYVDIVTERWRWFVAPLVAIPLLVLLASAVRGDRYEATARVLVARSAAEEAVLASNPNAQSLTRSINNEVNLARSDRVEAEVRSMLGLDPDDELPGGRIRAEADTDVVSFSFLDEDPAEAAEVANAWADAYVGIRRADTSAVIDDTIADLEEGLDELQAERLAVRAPLSELEDELALADEEDRAVAQLAVDREASRISGQLALLDTQIASVVDNISELSLSRDLAARGSAEVFERAAPPSAPANASPLFNLVLAILPAAAIGGVAAIVRHNVDRHVDTADQVEQLGFSVLTTVPTPSEWLTADELALVAATRPGSAVADAYQRARTAIAFAGGGVPDADGAPGTLRSIVVTSPNQSDGKTTTSANLAVAFAATGRQVVLVDADLRRPRLHQVFGVNRVPGLTDIISSNVPLGGVAARTPDTPPTLIAIPAGAKWPSPSSFLSGTGFRRQAAALHQAVHLVVYDAPPVLAVSDALSVAQQTDGTVLVVRAGRTTRDELTAAAHEIEQAGARLLGVVLVGVDESAHYGDYYRKDP